MCIGMKYIIIEVKNIYIETGHMHRAGKHKHRNEQHMHRIGKHKHRTRSQTHTNKTQPKIKKVTEQNPVTLSLTSAQLPLHRILILIQCKTFSQHIMYITYSYKCMWINGGNNILQLNNLIFRYNTVQHISILLRIRSLAT